MTAMLGERSVTGKTHVYEMEPAEPSADRPLDDIQFKSFDAEVTEPPETRQTGQLTCDKFRVEQLPASYRDDDAVLTSRRRHANLRLPTERLICR